MHDDIPVHIQRNDTTLLRPRSSSPPLVPRKNAEGLPPTYLTYLRALLHQWLVQQTHDAGLPTSAPSGLWDDETLQKLEKSLWRDAVLPQGVKGRKGLLQEDWAGWAVASSKRRNLWKEEKDNVPGDFSDVFVVKKRAESDAGAVRGTNSRTVSGLMMSTPNSKATSRAPSIASTSKAQSEANGKVYEEEIHGEAKDGGMREWCRAISGLEGFERYISPKKDEWEVIADDLPPLNHSQRQIPGAFPQAPSLIPRQSTSSLALPTPPLPSPSPSTSMTIKPIICLHFPPPPWPTASISTSTLHLKRQISTTSSIGSSTGNGRWWSGVKSGSGGRSSDMTIVPTGEELAVEYVSGKYALPMMDEDLRRGGEGKGKAYDDDFSSASNSTEGEGDSGLEEGYSSAWSGTQRADPRLGSRRAVNVVLAGRDSDMPRIEIESERVRVVGGTIIIKGVYQEGERKAIETIFKLLLYSIQTMYLELELLDAFRIPRESDPIPLPPKPKNIVKPNFPGGTQRRISYGESGKKGKGFFQRLGKDTKGMWDGLLGKSGRKSLDGHGHDGRLVEVEEPITPTAAVSATFSEPGQASTTNALSSKPNASPSLPTHTTDRHLQLLSTLEQLLPSVTPGLCFPLPPLLLRVKEENRLRQEKAAQEIPGGLSGIFEGLSRLPGGGGAPQGRALGYRLGGDVKAGLGALMGGLDTVDGWVKLQSLEMLYCTGTAERTEGVVESARNGGVLCERPRNVNYQFWHAERDTTIGGFMSDLEGETRGCEAVGCEKGVEDHTKWWIHGGKKVGLKLRRLEGDEKGEIGCVDAWVKCRECGKESLPRTMNDAGKLFSWGKYLEILIYTDVLCPPNLCLHMVSDTSSPSSVDHVIRSSTITATLHVESVSVLDARLPKPQVGPNVAKRKAGTAIAAMEGVVRKDIREKDKEVLKQEMKTAFEGIRRIIVNGYKETSGPDAIEAPDKDISSTTAETTRSSLLEDLDKAERDLVAKLDGLGNGPLNDVRSELCQAVQAAIKSVQVWQKKETTFELDVGLLGLPDYVGSARVHTLPGSNVLLREDEPSSMIAYTLSSLAYFAELISGTKHTTPASDVGSSSTSTVIGDTWDIEVKRRETPRDLLSLRTITKKRSAASMGSKTDTTRIPLGLSLTPNQPSLELSLEMVEGKSQTGDRMGDFVRTISKANAKDAALTLRARSPSLSDTEGGARIRKSPQPSRPPTLDGELIAPPSAFRRSVTSTVVTSPTLPVTSSPVPFSASPQVDISRDSEKEGWSSVTSGFTNSFNNLLRMGSGMGDTIGSIRMRGTDRSLSSLIGGPLPDQAANDDKPHIQFTYTLGDKLRFSCTVYFASVFDTLRRRCAVDKSFVLSLTRCERWDVSGGKSKAAFYLTQDKKYVIKELISKWNVSDTQALLDSAPAYLDYLSTTHNKATSLAKVVGFYSIKMHDLQSNNRRQMDLLVMENLFYKQTVGQTYDLKGIEGRRVPVKPVITPTTTTSPSTLFDGEWIEGQSKAPILLHPHAKRILHEAISMDTRFLSSQSIMDYSLLLGLDAGKGELVIGLVDAIGSFGLFKTFESRGKLALNRGGEVTVIPPHQYRERFEIALKEYFIACPDKWSRITSRGEVATIQGVPSML